MVVEGLEDTLYTKVSECSGTQLILDWMDNWLLLNEGHQKKE